jgi:hypothetical protein
MGAQVAQEEIMDRYEREAEAPRAATLFEALRFQFDEIQRRAYHSTKGLTAEQVDHDPGQGSWGIGAILAHQIRLTTFIINTLRPGTEEPMPPGTLGNLGSDGHYDLPAILVRREQLNETFRRVWAEMTESVLMEKRPDLPPAAWAEWPVLMRILRPMTDLATHIGQVNYLRRRLGNPVGKY